MSENLTGIFFLLTQSLTHYSTCNSLKMSSNGVSGVYTIQTTGQMHHGKSKGGRFFAAFFRNLGEIR